MCYCFFLAGCQSRKRLRLIDARPPIEQAHILARPCKLPGFSMFDMNVLSTKKQEGLVAGVCWCSMTSVKLSADSVDEEKKSPVKAGNDSFWKWSWLTSPSIHGDLKKSRRCFLKESSILSKRIVGAKRENRRFFLKESSVLMGSKSIYSPKSLNCYVSGGNNTWQKHSKMALMYSSNFIGWMTSAFSRAALSTIGQLPCRQSG